MKTRCAALVLALTAATTAGPARADRPSLLDLQAAVDGLVSPPPAAASGTLVFEPGPGQIAVQLVDLVLAVDVPVACPATCAPAGSPTFETVRATVLQGSGVALLTADLLASATAMDVAVSIPSEPALLAFQDVVLQSVESGTEPGRVVLELSYQLAHLEIQGTFSEWNRTASTGGGCGIPPDEEHLDLMGNDPSNLGVKEIESAHQLGIEPAVSPPTTLSFSRTPPNACYLRGAASAQIFGVSFDRLWESNDQFPGTRQASESIDLGNAFVDRWELHVESGTVREETRLVPQSGSLTTRDFSPVDGSETASHSVGF